MGNISLRRLPRPQVSRRTLIPDCTGVDFYLCLPREVDGDFPRMEVQGKI